MSIDRLKVAHEITDIVYCNEQKLEWLLDYIDDNFTPKEQSE